MRIPAVLVITHLAVSSLGQSGVYIRPQFDHKWNRSACKGERINLHGASMVLLPKRFFSGSEMSFGLAAGYKRVKWLVDVSTGEDGALYAFKLYGYGVGGGPGYIKTQLTGVTYYRTMAMLGARLMWLDRTGASRRVRWELWGTLAAHRWRRYDGPSKIDLRGSWEVSATETITYSLDQNSQTVSSAFIAPGVMIKGFNRKGHSIVNLHLQYAWGLSREHPFAGRFSFTHQPTGDKAYATFSSRGDGLYVAVSKDFYLNNALRIFKRKPASESFE